MNRQKCGLLWFSAVIFMLVIAAISCAPKAQEPIPAVKPTEVWFRATCPMTGLYGGSLGVSAIAVAEAVKYINEQLGGIDGVPLKYQILDDAADVATAEANYERQKAEMPKHLITGVWHSGIAQALKERFNEDDIICMTPAVSAAAIYPAGNTFGLIVSYPDTFGLFCDWLVETQPKPIKLAFCTWDSTMGKAVLTDECLNYAKSKGIEIVATELYGVLYKDVSTQLTKIKAAGANWVYSNTLGPGPLVLLKSADSLGLLGGDMKFALCHFAMFNDEYSLLGSLGEGVVGPMSFRTWDEVDNPYVQVRRKAFAEAGYEEKDRGQVHFAFQGWFEYIDRIYENAIAEVGWDKLNTAALKKQIHNTKDLDIGPTIWTFSADKPEPTHARIVQFKGGKVLPITDWRVCPDLKPSQ